MFGTLVVTFLIGCVIGCVVGAVINDLARWQRQRSAAQNLLRALDSGTIHYGGAGRAVIVEQDQNNQSL